MHTTTFRNGDVIFANFNTKRQRVEAALYANRTQAENRVAKLAADGVNAEIVRYPLSRVFYVRILAQESK
jgi:cell division protein FtsN